MAQSSSHNGRHWAASPRSRARENARNTVCRNILIYGHCRHEKDGCIYNHEKQNNNTPRLQESASKGRLNVESPSFTPAELPAGKPKAFSPQAASAAIFTPTTSDQGANHALMAPKTTSDSKIATSAASSEYGAPKGAADWGSNRGIPEFVPRMFQQSPSSADVSSTTSLADPFTSFDGTATYLAINSAPTTAQVNPYATDNNDAVAAAAFFQQQQQQQAFSQHLQHHLYAPLGPHRENLLPYQRTVHNFFIAESMRQEFQRQNEATLQVLPSLNLPHSVDHFHTLVPLDTNHNKTNSIFGYPTWTYKATSSKDGLTYVIRRLEGYRLTNEKAIYSKQLWRRVDCGNVVAVLDCFTTRAFGDSSLVFVTDYHPLAKTLAEQHLPSQFNRRPQTGVVPEQTLWSYAVQIASALKVIHSSGLAARTINASKILLTAKNRIRLSGCGMLDVIKFEEQTPLEKLQRDDLRQLGQLLFTLATMNTNAPINSKTAEALGRTHGDKFKSFVMALADSNPASQTITDINDLTAWLTEHTFSALDQSFHLADSYGSTLSQELEHGRIARLMIKLACINERPEQVENSPAWAETGERYYLKLFRDYVFHQVGPSGNPVVDLAHILTTLNKLDAGSEEKVTLTSRDEATVFVITYKELKRGLDNSFAELLQAQRRA